jgi:hypothetical protein
VNCFIDTTHTLPNPSPSQTVGDHMKGPPEVNLYKENNAKAPAI